MNNNNSIENLHKYIQKVAKKTMGASVEQTILTGTITHIAAGIYEVQIEKTTDLVAATAIGDATYKEGDKVFLLLAESNTGDNLGKQYQIFGLVNLTETAYKMSSEYERFVADLKSQYKDKDKENEFYEFSDEEYDIFESLSGTKPELIQNIKLFGVIDLTASFELDKTLDSILDYGLKLQLLQLKGENKIILEEVILNTPYFIGQPYKKGKLEQHRFVQINKDKKDFVEDISLVAFNNTGTTLRISNIQITSGEVLDFTDRFSIKINSNSTYINNNPNEDITITATGYFDNQALSADVMKYFWFIKDNNITSESAETAGFNALAGAGWRCLNTLQYAKEVNGNALQENLNIKLWDAKNNFLKLNRDSLKDYENIIKCIALYQDVSIESKELIVYNFQKENFNGNIIADKTNLVLIYPDDKITLTCNIIDNNIVTKTKNYVFTYKWYIDNTEIIIESNNELEVSSDYINESQNLFEEGTHSFFCEVYIDEDILIYDSFVEGPEIKIESKVKDYLDKELTETINYSCWVSQNNNEIFNSDISNEADGFKYKVWSPENDDLATISGNPNENNSFKDLESGNYFVYVSEQIVISKGSKIFEKLDWSKPIILRYIQVTEEKEVIDIYDQNVLDQQNIFNTLTNNGTSQGIFYKDNEVFINATYIKTGAFTVEDDNNKILFQAGWDKDKEGEPLVQIAGFKVDNITFQSKDGKVGLSSSEEAGEKLIWAGGKETPLFYVTSDGSFISKGSGSIGSTKINHQVGETKYDFYGTNGKFSVTTGGILKATDAEIEGTITAEEGSIGGFHIKGNHLGGGSEDNSHLVMLSGFGVKTDSSVDTGISDGDFVFWAGDTDEIDKYNDSTRPFYIKKDGYVKATSGNIAGIDINENGFYTGNITGIVNSGFPSVTPTGFFLNQEGINFSNNLKIINGYKINNDYYYGIQMVIPESDSNSLSFSTESIMFGVEREGEVLPCIELGVRSWSADNNSSIPYFQMRSNKRPSNDFDFSVSYKNFEDADWIIKGAYLDGAITNKKHGYYENDLDLNEVTITGTSIIVLVGLKNILVLDTAYNIQAMYTQNGHGFKKIFFGFVNPILYTITTEDLNNYNYVDISNGGLNSYIYADAFNYYFTGSVIPCDIIFKNNNNTKTTCEGPFFCYTMHNNSVYKQHKIKIYGNK